MGNKWKMDNTQKFMGMGKKLENENLLTPLQQFL
jgi:hypothetical protein